LLVARERADNYKLSQQPARVRNTVKRARKLKAKSKLFYCAVFFVALCLAFLITAKYAQITSMGYEIVNIKKQAQALNLENQAIQNKIDELKALKNIEYIATTRLGMKKPELVGGVQFVPVEYSKTGLKETTGVVAGESLNNEKTQKRNSIVRIGKYY
jgi:cell division protein FtsL